jgi:hypothetical protein
MDIVKTKSLKGIEERMENLDKNSLRYQILESAKNFKTSWIDLGRALYCVWKDKMYKEWGFGTFESYTAKEIGIRKQTAMKLLRSYYFLEKEEPIYLKNDYVESSKAAVIPSYESVDLLRLAKNKKTLDRQDYANLKKEIFENGKDYRQLRHELTAMIRQREELEPEEAQQKRKLANVKRLLSALKTLKQEAEILKLLPASLIKETASLINKLEAEIS